MIGNAIAGLYGVGVTLSTTAYESIATNTVGSGGSSTITFSSIPSTFSHLQLRYLSGDQRASAYDSPINVTFNSDSSSVYAYHELVGDGSTANSYATTGATKFWIFGGGSSGFGVGVLDVLDYQNTNKFKTTRNLSGVDGNGVGGNVHFVSGLWRSTSAVSSITLTPYSGNFRQYSHFALYGIKGA